MEIEKDYDEAKKYYKKGADKDDTKSQYRLAKIYDKENKRDDAIEYYEKAIEGNFTLAKFSLANLYNGESIKDKIAADLKVYTK